MDRATSLGFQLGLPIENHLLVRAPGQPDRALAGEEYYVPGSILRVAVDNDAPVAAGCRRSSTCSSTTARCSASSRMRRSRARRRSRGSTAPTPLRSGWAWGQNYLEGGAAIVESNYGKGKVYLFGPEITFRGQPHGTFKFLFNGIYAPTQPQGIVP